MNRRAAVAPCRAILVLWVMLESTSCNVVGPSCTDETGTVLTTSGRVEAEATASYIVTSPKSSNLVMRLTWTDGEANLKLRATITHCGGHPGCSLDTIEPPFGPGGPSPTPLPWPPGLREMVVDGWVGKTYRIDIAGDALRPADFTLGVTYKIACES